MKHILELKSCSQIIVIYSLSCLMKIITLMAVKFWILENDDIMCNPRIVGAN